MAMRLVEKMPTNEMEGTVGMAFLAGGFVPWISLVDGFRSSSSSSSSMSMRTESFLSESLVLMLGDSNAMKALSVSLDVKQETWKRFADCWLIVHGWNGLTDQVEHCSNTT